MLPKVCVIGGAGHVGAPLSILLACRGVSTAICDKDQRAVETLASGRMPFIDEGAEVLLGEALSSGMLVFNPDPVALSSAQAIVLTIGTPVDEFQNPVLRVLRECADELLPYLRDGQLFVLRSTVFPGVTEWLDDYFSIRERKTLVAFCPERVVQGRAIVELQQLPQIVSGTTPEAEDAAAKLFARITPRVIRMLPREAEYAKLICNAYRYLKFAATNQFRAMVEDAGCNYDRILDAIRDGYPRADVPNAGFAAGPCLYKDTLQLAAGGGFELGHAAIRANEDVPAFVIRQLERRFVISQTTVGILGMAFKPDIDDARSSLSYKLQKLLEFRAKRVIATDPHVNDPSLLPLDRVIDESDVLVLAVRHRAYEGINFQKPVVFA